VFSRAIASRDLSAQRTADRVDRRGWAPFSRTGRAPSLSIAELPVIAAAANFVIAIATFVASATRATLLPAAFERIDIYPRRCTILPSFRVSGGVHRVFKLNTAMFARCREGRMRFNSL